jgi:hypothetical protein
MRSLRILGRGTCGSSEPHRTSRDPVEQWGASESFGGIGQESGGCDGETDTRQIQ